MKTRAAKRKLDTHLQDQHRSQKAPSMENQSSSESPPDGSRKVHTPDPPQSRTSSKHSLSAVESAQSTSPPEYLKMHQRSPRSSSIPRAEQPKEHDASKSPAHSRVSEDTSMHLPHFGETGYSSGTRYLTRNIESSTLSQAATRTENHHARHSSPTINGSGQPEAGFFSRVTSALSSVSPLPKNYFRAQAQATENGFENAPRDDGGRRAMNAQTSSRPAHTIEMQQKFQSELDIKELEWRERERSLRFIKDQTIHSLENKLRDVEGKAENLESTLRHHDREMKVLHGEYNNLLQAHQELQSTLQKSESKTQQVKLEYDTFKQRQQEAHFKQMEPAARWMPKEDGAVKDELDTIKEDMRNWAKAHCVKDFDAVFSLGEKERSALGGALKHVVLFEDDQLPGDLLRAKRAPMLLLNALLTHSVYTNFFNNPFFMFNNTNPKGSRLKRIYQMAKRANLEGAHMWRSQTMRLLLPPLSNEMSDGGRELRSKTESWIQDTASIQASAFLSGPARHLIDMEANPDCTTAVKEYFSQAAVMACDLWTRRIDMRCFTHENMNAQFHQFDPESRFLDPDRLVRADDHDDRLKGKSITILLHPVLLVYGTDEATDYDKPRVWTKGVVWLDS